MSTRQIIVIRKDLNMRKGKIGAQAAHASMKVFFDAFEDDGSTWKVSAALYNRPAVKEWVNGLFKKIVVSVNSEAELLEIYEKAKEAGLPCSLIQDSGLTEFKEPTYTAVGIGPAEDSVFPPLTGHLPLL